MDDVSDNPSLVGVVNRMPHPCLIYTDDKKTVITAFNPFDPPLRLVGEEPADIKSLNTSDGKKICYRVGAPKYTGLNTKPPNVPVIVSDLVARHLLETGFKHPIYSPDTSPEAVVRGPGGNIEGTTRLVYHV